MQQERFQVGDIVTIYPSPHKRYVVHSVPASNPRWPNHDYGEYSVGCYALNSAGLPYRWCWAERGDWRLIRKVPRTQLEFPFMNER